MNYNEAENVVSDYNKLVAQSETIYNNLPQEKRDAFYQIVLFPVKACANINEMYLSAAKNALYASQKRSTTNAMAAQTRTLFSADTTLMSYYNHVYANGNWNHFMDKPHIGYTGWDAPRKNTLNAIKLTEIQVPDSAIMGIGLEGTELSWPNSTTKASLPQFDIFSNQQRYIEVFNQGKLPFDYTITTDIPWLTIGEAKGTINDKDKRIWLELDKQNLPTGKKVGIVRISGAGT